MHNRYEDQHMRSLYADLDDARMENDQERVEELLEIISEYKDWLAHCQETHWEWEREDARMESWEVMA